MEKSKLTIPDLAKIHNAQTVRQVWENLNNDQFSSFQVLYRAVIGATADMGDDSLANAPNIRKTEDCMVRAVELLNDILSLDPGDRQVDRQRCNAMLHILQDETGLGTSRDHWTPLQELLIAMTRTLAADFATRSAPEPDKDLIVLS